MRARIALAVVAILVGALTVAGALSLTLERHAADRRAEATVLRQARALAASLSAKPLATLFASPDEHGSQAILHLVDSVAGTRGAVLVVTDGRLRVDPLAHVPSSAIDASALGAGKPASGVAGDVAFAAVPILSTSPALAGIARQTVAYGLESPVSSPASSVRYYLLASGIALVVAAAAASEIARRISRGIVAASGAAARVAGGDLEARVEVPAHVYPEIAGLASSLNAMAATLARARHLERAFLLSISHDLRTPLTSILGYAEAIADHGTPDPARAAEIVVSEARRLQRLIGDLLDLARLDAHQFSLHLAEVDAGQCAADAADALRYAFEAASVDLVVEPPPDGLVVSADPDRLAQVVANLAENALKFARSRVLVRSEIRTEVHAGPHVSRGDGAPPPGRSGRPPGGRAVVVVEDDGPGIAPEDLSHIFERLFTSSRQPTRAAGTGLGLAIVAELVSALHGEVHVDSPLGPDGGTRMMVDLPLVAPRSR
jgi:two-component system sensor histidine kinase BaeS